MISRRSFVAGVSAAACLDIRSGFASEAKAFGESLPRSISAIEAQSGGRLGVAVHDAGSGRHFAHRGDERFPLCSTFKFLLAAAILAEVDKGRESLTGSVPVRAGDIITYSPTTEKFAGRDATVAILCEAAMTLSDNAAANLLLPKVGGPEGLTRFLRTIGDPVTRLDRNEPTLNESVPGDPRDTTSPNAMCRDLERLVLGDVLSEGSRRQLTDWLVQCKTGDTRLRAALPAGWRAGDKTGTGANGSANDVAILWPLSGGPLLVASYLTQNTLKAPEANAVHAAVGRAVVEAVTT